MERIKLLTKETAGDKSKELLADIEAKNGKVINIFKVMANSPATLKTYFGIVGALADKTLDKKIVEAIGVQIAYINNCEYCQAAHSYLAKGVLSEDEIAKAREGKSDDAKIQAALNVAAGAMKKAGKISDEEFEKAKQAGLSDGEILEIGVVVSLNFFTNIVNNLAETRVDFPKA